MRNISAGVAWAAVMILTLGVLPAAGTVIALGIDPVPWAFAHTMAIFGSLFLAASSGREQTESTNGGQDA